MSTSTLPAGQHGITEHSDGGWGLGPIQTRSERFASTRVTDFPDVTGREVNWKHTPVGRLGELLTGVLDGSRYAFEATPADGVSVDWMPRTDSRIGRAGVPEDRASAAAWSAFEEALAIDVTGEGGEFTLTRRGLGQAPRAAHTVITAAPHSSATIILLNEGAAHITENVELVLAEGSNISVISLQQWADDATHLATHFASIGRDAHLKHMLVSFDGAIVRVNPSMRLVERGAGVEAFGLYFADAGQHLEQQVFVNHIAPNTRSRVNYKGALQGEGARTVWIGDVLIGRDAAGTDSYEQNRNLVLTDGTRADSIPNLEIETGDIAGAGHASTTGRFEDEQLFYLQSRGIPEPDARRLVVRGFLNEIVQQVGVDWLQERLHAALEGELEVSQA